MRKCSLLLLLLTLTSSLRAQVNYVLNPGFETYWKCPYDWNQAGFANYWSPIDSNMYHADTLYMNNASCSPEYLNTCARNNGYSGITHNPYFIQNPRNGSGMFGLVMYFDEGYPGETDQRDYLQGRLYKKLTAGKAYCISFWVNLEEASQYGINKIGTYLDDGGIDTAIATCGLPQTRYMPQVFTNTVVSDEVNWTKIEGSFIANGAERFITIGNFFSTPSTTAVIMPFPSLGINHFAFYLVDDVSVIELNLPADAGPDRYITRGDSTFIGRTPEVGLDCTWYRNGAAIGTGAGIWVKPQTTTSYVVEQTVCGLVKKDTVKVEVWPVGIKELNQSCGLRLYPNPSSDGRITLKQGLAQDGPVRVSITNSFGKAVYRQTLEFKGVEAVVQPGRLAAGMYWLRVEGGSGDTPAPAVLRFVVE